MFRGLYEDEDIDAAAAAAAAVVPGVVPIVAGAFVDPVVPPPASARRWQGERGPWPWPWSRFRQPCWANHCFFSKLTFVLAPFAALVVFVSANDLCLNQM